MNTLRSTLQTLGWPAGMSDAEIAAELLRRWFDAAPEAPLALSDVGIIARGVYAALVRAGDMAALRWDRASFPFSQRGLRPPMDPVIDGQQAKYDDADDDYIVADRRRGARTPRPALVDVSMDYGSRRAMGWLVDVSGDGAGLLMETLNAPTVGAQIEPVIHLRTGQSERLGSGQVVRTEMLSHDVGLVGVELDEPYQHAAA